jgi:hypothetical protein
MEAHHILELHGRRDAGEFRVGDVGDARREKIVGIPEEHRRAGFLGPFVFPERIRKGKCRLIRDQHFVADHVDAHFFGLQRRLGPRDDAVRTDLDRQRAAEETPDLALLAGDGIHPMIDQIVGVERGVCADFAHGALVVAVGQRLPGCGVQILHRQHRLEVAVVEPKIKMQAAECVHRLLGDGPFDLGENPGT